MVKIFMVKDKGSLRPLDETGEEALSRIPQGDEIVVEIKRPRNVKMHRKYFALLNLILGSTEYLNINQLLTMIKIRLGYVEVIIMPDGNAVFTPKSISFTSMSQDDFERFWSNTLDLVILEIIPGITRDTLEREVAEICGIGAFYRR